MTENEQRQTKLQVGDFVHTTQILGCSPGEEKVQVIKVNKREGTVEAVYGSFMDRAWVNINSCTFIKNGKINELHLVEPNPFIY